jgi:RNA polymerase sigma factor (sigma-70 family)
MKKTAVNLDGAFPSTRKHGIGRDKPNGSASWQRARATRKSYQIEPRIPLSAVSSAEVKPIQSITIAVEKRRTMVDEEARILLTALAQGDSEAFWRLWVGYHDYLYRLCLRQMGGNREEAEDALSKAMVKAWYCLPDYAAKINDLRAWLTRLILNLCVDIHRHRNRYARGVVSIEEMRLADEEDITQVFESPEQALLGKEMRLYLANAIDDLPTVLRRTSVLYFIQEMSYRDIADYLALSIENTRKRIQQARAILREKLRMYRSGVGSPARKRCGTEAVEGTNWKEPALAYYRNYSEIERLQL